VCLSEAKASLIASGFKKEPRYTLLVSQKSWQTNPLQVPQQGPYGKEGLPTGHFSISQKPHLSGSPVKEPPGPLMESLAEWWPITRALQHISQGPQWRRFPSQTPSTDPLQGERCLIHRAPLTISQSPWQTSPPPGSLCREQSLYGRRCPSPEPFSTYPTGTPAGGPSLQVPLTELPQREIPHT